MMLHKNIVGPTGLAVFLGLLLDILSDSWELQQEARMCLASEE